MENKQLRHQRTNYNYKQNREKRKKGAERGERGKKEVFNGKEEKDKSLYFDKIIMSSKDKFT